MSTVHGDERVADIGEFGLIRRIARILSGDDESTHFGDDTAILDQPGNNFLLATTDMLVDGVHFHRSSADPFDLGRRAVSINVSDIASMGGTPTFGLTSLALPPELPVEFVEQLYRGMHFEADRFGLQIVGGNTTRIVDLVVVDLALLGLVPKDVVVRRRGARSGDILAVTGNLGRMSAARLLEQQVGRSEAKRRYPQLSSLPDPRLAAGQALGAQKLAHAMLDLSDGLAGDVHHLAEESNVGLLIDAFAIPVDNETREISALLKLDPLSLAMTGGEDYELLVALAPSTLAQARRVVAPVPLTPVGTVLDADVGVKWRSASGRISDLEPAGWTHF